MQRTTCPPTSWPTWLSPGDGWRYGSPVIVLLDHPRPQVRRASSCPRVGDDGCNSTRGGFFFFFLGGGGEPAQRLASVRRAAPPRRRRRSPAPRGWGVAERSVVSGITGRRPGSLDPGVAASARSDRACARHVHPPGGGGRKRKKISIVMMSPPTNHVGVLQRLRLGEDVPAATLPWVRNIPPLRRGPPCAPASQQHRSLASDHRLVPCPQGLDEGAVGPPPPTPPPPGGEKKKKKLGGSSPICSGGGRKDAITQSLEEVAALGSSDRPWAHGWLSKWLASACSPPQ